MAKSNPGEVNKSKAIREYLAGHKRAKAAAVVAGLAEQGVVVSVGLVHQIKAKNRTKRGGAKAAAKSPRSTGSSAKISVDNLLSAKKLAAALGGVEKAKQLLDVLAKLG